MFLKVLVGIGLLLSVLAVVIATRPAAFRIARSTMIDAPPEYAFRLVNDFREWAIWSPYEKLDTSMKKSFDGPRAGTGAVYAYSGNEAHHDRTERLAVVDCARARVPEAFRSDESREFHVRAAGSRYEGDVGHGRS